MIFDELVHSSMREGIRASRAVSESFLHNDVSELRSCLERHRSFSCGGNLFVAVESVYSMDGDMAPLRSIVEVAKEYRAEVIVDEAHGLGVTGAQGRGLVHQEGLTEDVFATVYTFGKALGAHGAVVTGSEILRDYLIVSFFLPSPWRYCPCGVDPLRFVLLAALVAELRPESDLFNSSSIA